MRSRFEDPDVLRERQALAAGKSVGELSRITGFSDVPIPSTLTRMSRRLSKSGNDASRKTPHQSSESLRPASRGQGSETYSTLPRSLTQELRVRSKTGGDAEVLKQRQDLVRSKSPSELGQINSLSEIPVPRLIENWLSSSGNR